MSADITGDNMDHLQSARPDSVAVPNPMPSESKTAWNVSENDKTDARILSLGSFMSGRHDSKSLTIHCAALSCLIRDIITVYPGQNLTGNTLVFQEPYGALMHHMSDLERVYVEMKSKDEEPTKECAYLNHALDTLLHFLRPRHQKYYVPAQERLSQEQPTVTFDDMWVLLRPGSLAYASIDDHWIGCKVGAIVKWPADPKKEEPASWEVEIWYLQTDLNEEIGCATRIYDIDDFGGEASVTQFDVIPCRFYDKIDGGARWKDFEKRGQKILDILWQSARQYRHNGKSLLSNEILQGDVLVAGAHDLHMVEKRSWKYEWAQPSDFLPEKDPLYGALKRKLSPKRDSRDLFTETMHVMLSPCIHALTLWGAKLHLIHVDNIQPSNHFASLPEPILHHNQLHSLISLAERQGAESSVFRESHGGSFGKSIFVALIGGHGVGKGYTANYVSWKLGRPLITVTTHEIDRSANIEALVRFCSRMCRTSNAMILLRHTGDPYGPSRDYLSIFDQFGIMVFIVCSTTESRLFPSIKIRVHMVIPFSPLDYKRQQKLWLSMMEIYRSRRETKYAIDFDESASTFLSSADMPKVDWNGHDIKRSLQLAVLFAQAVGNPSRLEEEQNSITVQLKNLKEAMNMTFASRTAIDSNLHSSAAPMAMPARPRVTGAGAGAHQRVRVQVADDSSSNEFVPYPGRFHEYDELSDNEESAELPAKHFQLAKLDPRNARSRKLCIAELNMVEWSTFKTLGTSELFRSKRFYAIDILLGEPQILRELPNLLGQKRPMSIHSTGTQPLVPETTRAQDAGNSAANGALPERIRVNSPAIIRAFSELRIDDASKLRGSFLLFRPYKVLSYFEKELRNWTKKLEGVAQASREHTENVDKDRDEDLQADVAEMNCLLSFIDTHLKGREKRINDSLVQSLAFDDLWFLFKPGKTVLRSDRRQAYRIIRVATTRHHIKQYKETSLSLFRNNALVEFDQRCIFIECVHIDFDGHLLGPVLEIFSIPYFKGEKTIASLPIYPLESVGAPDMIKAFLIKRGQAFVKARSIRHMNYRGLTLPAVESSRLRDEVDSQVMIDFEEAFNRFPQWIPPVRKTVLEEKQEVGPSKRLQPPPRSGYASDVEWTPGFEGTQDTSNWDCIPECCSRETVYHDEEIDVRTRNDYMAYQANEHSATPSAAIEARTLSDLSDTLKDDDLLIMSFRVFGFVLRSRKWHQLDLADASPAATNSDEFDQLVLPEGHKSIVTSMITKHFRDRKSPSSRGQTDIVRGKGRGLVILLHGVPGVGKTSTAECLAGVFNRPLFQITSGDLGITAKDVDENLEENFSLANRWNCILLIDEADVFLAQRNKEDFVQNSLVAVFLRIIEYYSGVLVLTTNRVGVFDEAFSSRIHISLYYPPLDRHQTLEIFKKNWERILARSEEDGRQIDIDLSEIIQFAMDYFDNNKLGRWNGRQIRNAFQSALAMAEFEALDMDSVKDDQNDVGNGREAVQRVKLGKKHFEEVAKAYKGFVDYLSKVYGTTSARRARENIWRFDPDDDSAPKRPTALTQRLKFTGDPMQQPSRLARENMWRFDDDDESAPKRPTALTQRLKFTGDPMQQPPRNVDPSFEPSQHYRGYGPGHENPSNYGPMNPPRGGYAGSHEYHYSPAAFVPRTYDMEQGLYPDQLRAPGPSVNYPPAQPQTYGTRTHPAPPQHEMQTSQSNWASSSRDTQSGAYSYRPGEQALGAATGSNVIWGDGLNKESDQPGLTTQGGQVNLNPENTDIPENDETTRSPRQSWIAAVWYWLMKVLDPPPEGAYRATYTCGCGELCYVDLQELAPGGAAELEQEIRKRAGSVRCRNPNDNTSPSNNIQTPAPAHLTTSNLLHNSGQRAPVQGPAAQSTPLRSSNNANATASGNPNTTLKYLLLCVNMKHGLVKHENINVSNFGDDEKLFQQIGIAYKKARQGHDWNLATLIPGKGKIPNWMLALVPIKLPQWMTGALQDCRLFSPRKIEFVKFELMPIRRVIYAGNIEKPKFPGEAELKNKLYEYWPTDRRAEVLNVPIHQLLKQGDHLGAYWLQTFPKKLNGGLEYRDGVYRCGWGILISEGWNRRLILCLCFLAMMLFIIFVILYSAFTNDGATGAGIGSFIIAILTLYCTLRYEHWKEQ